MKCRSTIFCAAAFRKLKAAERTGVKSEGESESEDTPFAGAGVSKKENEKNS